MDLLSSGFVLLILVVSGGIAWGADKLGKKLGKKRLSIWGLRPRHVASLSTVGMGVFVSILTIGFVAAVSKDARTWLKEGSHLLVQLDQLRKDKSALEGTNQGLAKESERIRKANQGLEGSKAELEKANRNLQAVLDAERGKLAQAQQQRDLRLREAGILGSQVRTLEKSLATNRSKLVASQTAFAESQKSLFKLRSNLASLGNQVQASKRSLATRTQDIETANKNLQTALIQSFKVYQDVQRFKAEVNDLEERIVELVAQREKAEGALNEAQAALKTTQARLDRAGQDLDQILAIAQEQGVFLNEGYRSARTEALTFKKGEEVARFVVAGGADSERAFSALTTLLRIARVEAQGRGAKSHRKDGRLYEVADIVDRIDPNTNTAISADMLKRSVVTAVSGRVEDQILIATSSLNAFRGEAVSLEISVVPNPVIYHQGDVLSEARIDGSLTEDRIFAQLSEFVRTRVSERAVQDRMIPRAGTDAPFGEIPTFDVLNLVRDVKRVGRNVRVQAIAAADIHAAEPLRLEFHLK